MHPIWAEEESRSSLSVADRATRRLTEFYENGRSIDEALWAEFVRAAGERSSAAAWVTVSGSVPAGTPAAAYRELDVSGPLALDTVAPAPAAFDLVKVNAAEAADLTGIDTSGIDGAVAESARSAPAAPRRPSRWAPAARCWRRPMGTCCGGTLDEPGPYPVGSGDSFLAGLVVARAGGAGWDDALALALGAATANAAVPGAACFDRADAERLAERASVSRV